MAVSKMTFGKFKKTAVDLPAYSKCIPDTAVLLENTPVSGDGLSCDVDGDVDDQGRCVVFAGKQWWAY